MELLPGRLKTVALAKKEIERTGGLQVTPGVSGRVLVGVESSNKKVVWARFATVQDGKVIDIE